MVPEKTYLITGGTGSLGQALTVELLKHKPKAIRIFSRSEYLHWEMQQHFKDIKVRFFVGDVRDKDRLKRAMTCVDVVIHTAALKHVPICEFNPIEAVRTNIDGSVNVIDAAIDCHVPKVLAISSDKSVHPINLYGATKMVMEKLFVHANVYGDTMFSCVRFGNFEGSRGSVLPLWIRQKEEGEITITEKDMTRFWITLEEAAQFTITCLDKMEGGEIFIPRMPEKTLLELSQQIAPNARIKVIGNRGNEKLHELLFSEDELKNLQESDNCYIIKV